ncbi:hypothetical protein OHT57_03955 [Streptomyces sp. NBC_00285]|uniref:hypothetical protein n=1 Tax=Streptomyces sp. NBC_00285 TaxID=2975700 RepID=UPI002E2AF797|nr:hypothetical protein [Streptomyces sp. NBC_00285]
MSTSSVPCALSSRRVSALHTTENVPPPSAGFDANLAKPLLPTDLTEFLESPCGD